ncbi:MAG: DUF4012 domain-containing protein [Bifidobacteriaceae bacterium]|jgi:hypothetical protein|nr:DUF4012 domain-containing protein [Bifidobacteriaceae bacterium]
MRRNFAARHKVLTTLGLLFCLALVVGGWAAWQVWTLANNLSNLAAVVGDVQSHVRGGDLDALGGDISDAHRYAVAAYNAANDPVIRAGRSLPVVGDDIGATIEVAHVARDLTGSTATLATLLPRLRNQEILTPEKSIDLTLIDTVGSAVEDLATAAERGAARLRKIDTTDLLPQISGPLETLVEVLDEVPAVVNGAEPYLQLVPMLLGQNGERTWFVIMQNLDEARPSGGLLSSWLVLRTNEGKVDVLDQGNNDDLVSAGDVDYSQAMDRGHRKLWGSNLAGWLSMNLSADFPDNATLIRDAWNEHHNITVDGVVSFGQGTLPYLAAAVGSVNAGDKPIAPTELEEYLRVGVYKDYPDPQAKDVVVASMMMQVFTKLLAGEFDLRSFVDVISVNRSGDYVQMWSEDPNVQQKIVAAGLDGTFPQDEGPIATVRLVNAGGNKLDTFVTLGVDYALGSCEVDQEYGWEWRTSTLTTTLTSDVPDGLPEYMTGRLDLSQAGYDEEDIVVGSNRDFVVIYAPIGATIESVELDGEAIAVTEAELDERPAVVVDVETMPDQTRTITVTWSEPAIDSEGANLPTTPRVYLPPLANPASVTLQDSTACP